jgi:hypothetical protein
LQIASNLKTIEAVIVGWSKEIGDEIIKDRSEDIAMHNVDRETKLVGGYVVNLRELYSPQST